MLALLPLSALFLTILLIHQNCPRQMIFAPWRFAILSGATLFGTTIVLITEGLSLFHALTKGTVALSWAVLFIATGVVLRHKGKGFSVVVTSASAALFHQSPVGTPATTQEPLSLIERISLIGMAIVASLTLVIVLVAAPNNWDSLTYHLPRVMHWIQNQTVAFFVTPDARQICFPPWSEYHILQYQLLLGNDRLAALPQWLAFIGSGIAASLLAGQLGANRYFQIFTALITYTLPMSILQASSTQNDLTAAFWLLTALALALPLLNYPRTGMAILFGLAIGLSLLTKTTAYLFALPILLLLTVALLFRQRGSGLKMLILAGAMSLLINLPHYTRNIELCGHPMGDGTHHIVEYKNASPSIKGLASNLMRNIGLQFITPSTRINELIELGIRFGHKSIHSDINDPATTFGGNHYETKWLSTFEDDAANPLHFGLAGIFLPLGWFLIARGPGRQLFRGGVVVIGSGALLFCWVLMWQPFHSRQHLSLFLLAAPLIAVAIAQLPRPRCWAAILTSILLLTTIPYVLGNEIRPILFPMTPHRFNATNIFSTPHDQQYLTGRLFPESWRKAASYMTEKKFRSVGLKVQWFSCEYPLWLITKDIHPQLHIEHVAVTNMPFTADMRISSQAFTPDAILRFSDLGVIRLQPAPDHLICNGKRYIRTWSAYESDRPYAGAEIYTPVME